MPDTVADTLAMANSFTITIQDDPHGVVYPDALFTISGHPGLFRAISVEGEVAIIVPVSFAPKEVPHD